MYGYDLSGREPVILMGASPLTPPNRRVARLRLGESFPATEKTSIVIENAESARGGESKMISVESVFSFSGSTEPAADAGTLTMQLITRDHAGSRKRTGTSSSSTVVRIERSKHAGDVKGMASDTGRQTFASQPVLL
jgi:hypothetical protein